MTYYTEQLPPYNYLENGTIKGLSVDLLEAVTEKMGSKISSGLVKIVSWEEGYNAVLHGNNSVIFATARIPTREHAFQWAGPISIERDVLFANPETNITIQSLDDLKGLQVGVTPNHAGTRLLLDAGVSEDQIVTEKNVSVLINKLENKEIDLWCYPELTGRYYAEEVTGNYYAFQVAFPLEEIGIYYAFSRDIPYSTVQSFQNALDILKQEKDRNGVSTYEKILGKYIPSIGLSQLQYLTEEWAPFYYLKDGVPAGISVEILEAVFRNLEVNVSRDDVRIVPLSEGFQQAQGNNSTVLFSIVRSPQREPLYQWAGPFTRGSFVVFAPQNRNITIHSPEEMNQYRIGAVTGTIENTLLTNIGINPDHIVNGLVPDDLIRMLENGDIDLWATGDITGRYEMKRIGSNPDDYEIVYTLSENDFYFIFGKDVPDTLVRAFEHGLDKVRNQKDSQGISEYERIIYRNVGVGCSRQLFSDDSVVALVQKTARDIVTDAPGTLRRINAGNDPYRNATNPALYVFVYDTNLTTVAHADNPFLIGFHSRGKTDITGKRFHDNILAGALQNGSGWEEYVSVNPAQTNLYYKSTYYQLTSGSDGKSYIVGSGNFKSCNRSDSI